MIRKVTVEDREKYIALASEFYTTDAVLQNIPRVHFESTFDELMRSNLYAEAFFLMCEEVVAGYALLAKTYSQEAGGMVIWIEELYIQERYRGMGLGRMFFSYLEKNLPQEVTRIRLEVEDYNEKAIRLYERMGFEKLEYGQMVKDTFKS